MRTQAPAISSVLRDKFVEWSSFQWSSSLVNVNHFTHTEEREDCFFLEKQAYLVMGSRSHSWLNAACETDWSCTVIALEYDVFRLTCKWSSAKSIIANLSALDKCVHINKEHPSQRPWNYNFIVWKEDNVSKSTDELAMKNLHQGKGFFASLSSSSSSFLLH